jgi:hypothetical protein
MRKIVRVGKNDLRTTCLRLQQKIGGRISSHFAENETGVIGRDRGLITDGGVSGRCQAQIILSKQDYGAILRAEARNLFTLCFTIAWTGVLDRGGEFESRI